MKHRLMFLLLAMAVLACDPAENHENDPEPAPERQELPAPFTVKAADLMETHVQGIAASDDAVYLVQRNWIVRVNWNGRVLKSLNSETIGLGGHCGDVCWYDNRLYISYVKGDDGKIVVLDKNLSKVKECEIDRGIDGITCLDGVLYVGMGSKTEPSSEPHRVNILGRFDAGTLEEIAPRVEFDYGYETTYGFQDITNDGTRLYGAFYAVGSNPQIAVFDKDCSILETIHVDFVVNNGIDLMPAKFRGDRTVFLKARSYEVSPGDVACDLDYWILP